MERGLLIVFEGLDGCGKSTQLDLLCERLRAKHYEVIPTKEPTDGPLGRRIREMARSHERVAPEQELEWFMEDRRQHVRETLEPGLAAGAIVLSDRYWLSTVAYQGARGLDAAAILRTSEAEFPDPDLAMIFEIPAAEGLARVNARGGVAEPAFEELAFLTRAAKLFASIDRPWIEKIDARPSPDTVQQVVADHVRALGLRI